MNNRLQHWLNLLYAPGIGAVKGRALLNKHQDISAIPLKNVDQKAIIIALKWLEEPNHHLITLQDSLYPPLLQEISDAPLALFVNGNPKILRNPQLAIVGSRNPSHSGLDNAFDFAKYLAATGLTITSGLAMGIDTESHKGALAAKGPTIAVMGTGINTIYPARNKTLAHDIVRNNGALVSALPLDTPPKAENFPYRNRIVSGLSLGTLVIEATIRSGSLITARLAAEQGREVFALPGSIHNPLARGCHQLIRQGAKLIETAKDIIEELGPLHTFNAQQETIEQTTTEFNLDSDYQKLLDYIDYETTPIDILVERSGFKANDILSMLLILELNGYITTAPGGYIKNGRKL